MKDNYKYVKQGNLLYKLRTKRNMTQHELAKLIETDYRNISKYELGSTFPDKVKQEKLCEIFNITLEELHKGKINTSRRVAKILLYVFSVTTPILLIGIIALFITLKSFKANYDPSNIYYIDIEEKSSTYCNIDGIYINNKKENIIYIGTIKLLDYTLLDTDHIDFIFYYGDKIIYSSSSLENIMFKLDSSIPIDELKFTITITGNNKLKYENEYNINTTEFDKNTLTTARISDSENNKIINELLKIGFKKINDNEYVYTENSKDRKLRVIYFIGLDRLCYEEITSNLITSIEYYVINDDLNVKITSLNKTNMVIEDYKYNLRTKKLINNIGHGYTLKDSLKIMDKYLSRLKSE